MYASQIVKIVNEDKPMKDVFEGVYACDNLPQNVDKTRESAYVINSSPSNSIGEHWLLAYVNPCSRKTIWFDSYAKPLDFYNRKISQWVKAIGYPIESSVKRIQADLSIYCGLYVLYVYYFLVRHVKLKNIVQKFSKRLLFNDKIVSGFMLKHFSFNAQKRLMHGGKLYKEELIRDFKELCNYLINYDL